MTARLLVDTVHIEPGSTIAVAYGFDETGAELVIGGDWRPMQELAAMVDADGPTWAEFQPWQVLRVTR